MLNNECLKHIQNWYYICFALIFVILAGLVMIFRYFLTINKDGVVLKAQNKELDQKHHLNRQRIEELEKKNSQDLKEIETLKTKISTLEGVIRTVTETKQK